MARKSKAQIEAEKEAEFQAREAEIQKRTEERFTALLPSIIAATMQQMGGLRTADGSPLSSSPGQHDALAHAIVKASDPGNRRRIVAPEVMREREEARTKMMALISDFYEKQKDGDPDAMPVYQVIRKVVFAETLIEPQYHDPVSKRMMDQEINWPSIPNQALLPINAAAKAIHTEFLKWIGEPPVDLSKEPAPWVLSANQIMRGRSGVQRPEVQEVGPLDVRRHIPGAQTTRQKVLGTLATPAVVGP